MIELLLAFELQRDPQMEAFITLQALDIMTTRYGLQYSNIREMNSHNGDVSKMIMGKAISAGFLLIVKKIDKKTYNRIMKFLNVTSVAVLVNNLIVIQRNS